MGARYTHWLTAAALAGLCTAPHAHAELSERDLIALKSLETTLGLERDAADALREQDAAKLRRLSTNIRRVYAQALSAAPSIDRARNLAMPGTIGPCHLAGLTLRQVIVGFAEGRLTPRIRPDLIDAVPPDLTDQFAAHMQRCELTERVEPSKRKIGGTCLIDGKRCRESER